MTLDRSITMMDRSKILNSKLKKGNRYRFSDFDGLSLEADFNDIIWDEDELVMRLKNIVDPSHKTEFDGEKWMDWEVNEVRTVDAL